MQYLVKFGSNAAVGHGDPDMLVVEHVFILVERTGLETGARDALAHLFALNLRCFLNLSGRHVAVLNEYIFGLRATNSMIGFPFISSLK